MQLFHSMYMYCHGGSDLAGMANCGFCLHLFYSSVSFNGFSASEMGQNLVVTVVKRLQTALCPEVYV